MEYPIISCIQKVILYETKARFYIVGSNSTETRFRVLKIDRTEPKELVIHDDKVGYTKSEIRSLLTMIKSGNTNKESKKTDTALNKTVSAFGIAGFVRFLEGYYVILITKRRKVALIGPHVIFKIEDTSMLYIPNDVVRQPHHEESKYVKMFQSVDLSDNFYFSYSYDMTHTLQYNMAPTVSRDHGHTDSSQGKSYGVYTSPTSKYVWNSYLLEKCRDIVHSDWLLHLIHGFVDQKNICVYGKPVYLTLIARRSNKFAGARFLKRGANCQGFVANEVESEQIVIDSSVTFLDKTKVTSFVQMRGSIPLYWSQDVTKMVPKPPIMLDQRDPYAGAAGLHFNQVLNRYGTPLIILNLVKRREKKRHESILSEEFKATISYLNQFLPFEHRIRYIGFDMAQVSKSKTKDVLVRLAQIAKFCVKQTGLFINMPKPVEKEFWNKPEFQGMMGHETDLGRRQTGVVRTNCVDCLDRTNTAQFAIGKSALGYQLFTLGLISSPDLEFDTDCLKMLEQLYEAHGDTIALQYGGSQLVHRIEGYRKIAPWTSHSKDIMHTLSRYYSNTFSDLEKQTATNIFLGLFKPVNGKLNIWELPTDFYLHNKDTQAMLDYLYQSCSQWWDEPVYRSLPLPYEEVKKPEDCTVVAMTKENENLDHYENYYRTGEFTSLHELFSFNMSHSVRDYKPKSGRSDSPFILRISAEPKDTSSHEVNPNISGKESDSSLTSTGSDSSDSKSSDVDGTTISESSESSDHDAYLVNRGPHDIRRFTPPTTDYGPDLHKYTPNKHDTWMYDRYVKIADVCQFPKQTMKRSVSPENIIEIMSSMVRAVCWKCDEVFPSTRERKNHMANKVHSCLRVLCPWCPRERMYRRSTPELKDHSKREHRPDFERVTSVHKDFFSEANGFWLAMHPRDYGQLVEPTAYDSPSAVKARALITSWLGKTTGSQDQIKAWESGWNLYGRKSEKAPKRRHESPEPESSFVPDYEDDLLEVEAKRSRDEYTPDKPEIQESLILHSVNNKGQLVAMLHTEDNNIWYSCLVKKDLHQDPKAMASFFRRMSSIKSSSDIEPPDTKKLLGQSHQRIKNSIAETLGIPRQYIERITYGLRYGTSKDKPSHTPSFPTEINHSPNTSQTIPSQSKQSVLTISKPLPCVSNEDIQQQQSQSAFIPTGLPSSPLPSATLEQQLPVKPSALNQNKPVISVPPSPAKISTSSSSPLNLTIHPFRQTPSPNLNLLFTSPISTPAASLLEQPREKVTDYEPLNLTNKADSDFKLPEDKPSSENEDGKFKALELLRKGVMPLIPPAKREWSSVSSILLSTDHTQLFWPPENWKTLSADAKLFAWELAAYKLSMMDVNVRTFDLDRTTLLATFNMLALPGTAMPSMEKDKESEIYMRVGNYRMLSRIATHGIKNVMENKFLEMLSTASQLRDTSTDWLTNKLDEVDVKLRLPK